jgi:hypothetical protein
MLQEKPVLLEALQTFYYKKNHWYGCQGLQSVIDLSFLTLLVEKYDFLKLMNYIDSKIKFKALERIFALICTFEKDDLTARPSIFGSAPEAPLFSQIQESNEKEPVAMIFVCHDNESMSRIIHHNYYIIWVGNREISDLYMKYPKLIIARNLENNIEYEPRLLTFTAWYAIVKNDLFMDYSYLCILEYDVLIVDSFEKCVKDEIIKQSNIINLSFLIDLNLLMAVDQKLIEDFLVLKDIDPQILSQIKHWGCSTNQCIHRDVLKDFVEWYSDSYSLIKKRDSKEFSFYHERLFMIYLKSRNIEVLYYLQILSHLQIRSHTFYPEIFVS